ncbi:hypothetical protein [Microcoleus sp. F4-D5]|uniref:hypothetical protein n=1 Tax=Microcoleus sp. F4-D5 TaxID=2818760 RepID=UPI002FD514D7
MTPTGNLRIVFDNVSVQVELHFCAMQGRAIARGGQLVGDGKFSIAFLTDAPLREI